MNQRIKKKWIKALRSGEYVQGRHAMCRVTSKGDVFCCLGVLCDLHAEETDDVWKKDSETTLAYHGCAGMPPGDVGSWAGEEDLNPLARMNDGGRSFSEIADWIEENL